MKVEKGSQAQEQSEGWEEADKRMQRKTAAEKLEKERIGIMKKCRMIVLGVLLIFGLTACKSTGNSSAGTSAQAQTEAAQEASSQENSGQEGAVQEEKTEASKEEAEEASSETVPEGTAGKTLVVYYSATGNTREAADYIAEVTGGEVFELEPEEAYTSDDLNWRDEDSRVSYEHENPEAREVALVADTVPDWESYDTVFIGYPIWWGIAAWPVDGFVKNNDFIGKTVIPFCTSASSGLGESGSLLAEMAGTGDWLEGERFPSCADQETVQDWVKSLRL